MQTCSFVDSIFSLHNIIFDRIIQIIDKLCANVLRNFDRSIFWYYFVQTVLNQASIFPTLKM